ncbi:MAG: hypothetical protein AAF224_09890 [Pseudomonadota bacterium]
MIESRADNASRFIKSAAPTALGVFGVILLASPIRLFEGAMPTPLLPLVVVYFWSIYSPAHLPAFGVFVIGLCHDLLAGGPIGLWPLIYLTVSFVVSTQRPYFQGREQRVVWLGFTIASLIAGLMLWLSSSLLAGALLPITPLALQLAATIALYPVIAALFVELHGRVIVEA